MSVKLREAAAAKLPLGALNPARLWPLAGYAAALAAGRIVETLLYAEGISHKKPSKFIAK